MELSQIRSIKTPELTIPSFKGTLRNFQKTGVLAAYLHPRIIIGDDTGLGKTVQSVALLNLLSDQNKLPLNSTLIICPNGMRDDWLAAFKKFTPLKAIIGWTEDRNCKYLSIRNNAVILGYSTILNRMSFLEKHNFQTIIIDEASTIKNTESKTFQAVKKLIDKASRVVILNATSIENGVQDAYAMGELLETGFFGSYDGFLGTYCETETKYFRTRYHTLKANVIVIGPKSLKAVEALKAKLSKFYFRRSYADVEIEMPGEVVRLIPVTLKPEQKKEYAEQTNLFKNRKIKGASLLYKLLRICDGKMEGWSKVDKPEKVSAKGEALLDLANSFNEPFIVYSTYIDPLLAAAKILTKAGKRIGFYSGINPETREQHSAEFIAGKRDCLLITKAGARGKNWKEARHLIELNSVYNPSLQHQIRSRIKRMDSLHKTVFIYKLYAENTIEENVLALLDRKGALAKYINEDGTELSGMTDDQVELLLSKRISLINAEKLDENLKEQADEKN
jgi:SNF2 family DNA or RNA helicase